MDRHRELLRYLERTYNDAVAAGDRQKAGQAAKMWLATLRVIKQINARSAAAPMQDTATTPRPSPKDNAATTVMGGSLSLRG
jgi:hypothetical protein